MHRHTHTAIIFLITHIEKTVNHQLNLLLHHPAFQHLESAWRSLILTIYESRNHQQVIIKVLDLSEDELQKDLHTAIDCDQSQLFKKVHDDEYDHPGGLPFGLLIGNYHFSHKHANTLSMLARIAASIFAPFVSGLAPEFFGINNFSELQSPLRFENMLRLPEYQSWHQLRGDEDSRYIGLALPRILLRNPYNRNGIRITHRFFTEDIHSLENYLWGNAAFAYACVVIRTFIQTGWFNESFGLDSALIAGGTITHLPRNYFSIDRQKQFARLSTDIALTDLQEKTLADLGLLALKDNPALNASIFYSSSSLQQCFSHNKCIAHINATIATRLHIILCVSRFAHYVKVMMRDKIGQLLTPEEAELFLQNWLLQYCAASQTTSTVARAKYPLHEAKVKVQEQRNTPGKLTCILHLQPHFQFEEINTHLRLLTEINL